MATLFIDRKGLSLRVDGAALAFYDGEKRAGTVQLKVLERVCIRGDLQLSASVLGKLGEQGVGVLVLSGRKRAPVLLMPSLRVDARRRVVQLRLSADEDFCLQAARGWVAAKISAQAALLARLAARDAVRQARLAAEEQVLANVAAQIGRAADLAALRGLEGAAAAHYFGGWGKILPDSWGFSGRNRRPPRDAVNVVLSLGYTMLHFELVRQIYLAGLDPFVGFYHGVAHGRESLASDLLEPMRPIYDEWALALLADGVLRPEDFSMRGEGCQMGKAGRLRFYGAFETAAKGWRPLMYRACMDLLSALGAAAGETEGFVPSELMILEREDALADCV